MIGFLKNTSTVNSERDLRIAAQERSYEFFYKFMESDARVGRLERVLNGGADSVSRDELIRRLEERLEIR